MKFKIALRKRDALYKSYNKAQMKANKLKARVIDLELICFSLKRDFNGDKFERIFPISINFSGFED